MAKNMTAREIYAANVRRLLGNGPQKKVQQVVVDTAKKAGYRTDQKTISRAATGTNQTLDVIEIVAAGFGLEVWQMLMPERVLNFPATPRTGDLIDIVSTLNPTGLQAVIANARAIAQDPMFQADPKAKRQ